MHFFLFWGMACIFFIRKFIVILIFEIRVVGIMIEIYFFALDVFGNGYKYKCTKAIG